MSKKILVVDDEHDILSIVIFRIRKMGYDVITALNGLEAVRLLEKERPDCIVMDIAMPVMDGLAATEKIRQMEGVKDVPILILTASKLSDGLEARVKSAGADRLITKPFEPEELISTIRQMIS